MRNEENKMHDRNWELLPWLVNGSLPVDQIEVVEQHVAECEICAGEVRALQKLQAQLRDSGALLLAPQTSWQKMTARLDKEEELLTSAAATSPSRGRGLRAPRGWQALAAGQAFVIVGLAAAMLLAANRSGPQATDSASQPASYRTLTSGEAENVGEPTVLRVVFQRDATIAQVSALMRAESVQMLDGPSESGVYTLRAGPAVQLPLLLERLRSDRNVAFVEPQSFGPLADPSK